MSYPKNALSGARLALALVAVVCAPGAVRAADKTVLRPMFDLEQGWDSNVYNYSTNEKESPVTTFRPGLWIENKGELGFARLGVTAVGRSVWNESTLSGIDTGARGNFERKLTPRLTFFGNGQVDYSSGYDEIRDDTGSDEPPGSLGDILLEELPAWARDDIGGGFQYLLTPRTALRIEGGMGRLNFERVGTSVGDSQNAIDSSNGEYRDRSLWDARAVLTYQLTARDDVSLGVDGDSTSYQDLGTGSNDSEIWAARLSWNRNWSPVWSTSLSIGARTIDSTQNDAPQSGGIGFMAVCTIFGIPFDCPQQERVALDERSFSGSGTGLIGSIAIQRAFERSLVRLSYDRDTRSTGGTGRTNFDIDAFTLSLTHRLAERVMLTVSGSYQLYGSVTDEIPSYAASVFPTSPTTESTSCYYGGTASIVGTVPHPQFAGVDVPIYQCFGGSAQEDRTYTTLTARLDWQLRRQLNAYLIGRYYHSTTDQLLGSGVDLETDDQDRITIGLGFRYAWDLGL